jgi:hypothetical protein
MSGTFTSPSPATVDQPNFHLSNVAAHPGSSAAGIGLGVLAAAQGIPTNAFGWVMFGLQAATAVLSLLGK